MREQRDIVVLFSLQWMLNTVKPEEMNAKCVDQRDTNIVLKNMQNCNAVAAVGHVTLAENCREISLHLAIHGE